MKKFEELTNDIKSAYEEGVTLEQAERLAAKFLFAQLSISDDLKSVSLDSRMKKSGLKAVRAAIYIQEATKSEKKPTESHLASLVEMNELVGSGQNAYDTAEVEAAHLQNYLNVFINAHIYFRGIARGNFGG